MLYLEYKKASIRHLSTSEFLISQINHAKNPGEEKDILRNAYYIAGYTIECIVTYAIYNYIGYSKSTDVTLLSPFNYRFGVGFYRKYWRPRNITPRFCIQSHNFQYNCSFFSAQGITDVNKIPHFDSYIPDRSMIPLFNSWKPEVRYVDYGFNKNDIISFVQLSKEIHNKTRQFITKD